VAAGLFLHDPALDTRGHARDRGSYREILSIQALWPVLPLIFVSYAVLISVRGLWIAPFLDAVHGFGTVAQGWAALFMGLAMGAGALLYAPIERAVRNPKRVALGGAVLTAINCVALGLFGASNASLAVALLVAIGLTGVSYAILMAHVRPFLPARSLGRGVTFTNFVFMAGAGFAQWVSGRFVQASEAAGLPPEATFERLFVALGLVLLAACAVYATSRSGPPYPTRPEPAP
jgi:sugar phosphate permease